MRKRKRILITGFLFAIFGAALFGLVRSKMGRCALVGWSDFEPIAPNVYVSPDMTRRQRNDLLGMRKQGEAQIAAWFGQFTATTIFIVSGDKARLEPYGISSMGTAAAHSNLVSTTIVLGPNGMNQDVVTHELAHAELSERVGSWLGGKPYPLWFDEGFATQFDHREEIGEAIWRSLTQDGTDIPSREQLFKDYSGHWNWQVHYGAARIEVGRWLEIVDKEGFFELLVAMQQGEPFEQAYERIEKERI